MTLLLMPFRWCWNLICFFLWPARFVEEATRDSIAREFEMNKQLLEKFPNRDLPAERVADFRHGREKQTQTLRRSILSSLVIVAVLCFFAWVTRALVGELPARWIAGVRVLSGGLILWAVLGRLGWKIQTWNGTSLPERVNDTWFKLTYGLGVYLLMLSVMTAE